MTAFDRQVGGNHYKYFKIQPTEFIHKNNLTFLQGCVIKRVCRYDKKGTPIEDLEKSIHEIEMMEELDKNLHFLKRLFKCKKILFKIPIKMFIIKNNLTTFQNLIISTVCEYGDLEEAKYLLKDKIKELKNGG